MLYKPHVLSRGNISFVEKLILFSLLNVLSQSITSKILKESLYVFINSHPLGGCSDYELTLRKEHQWLTLLLI